MPRRIIVNESQFNQILAEENLTKADVKKIIKDEPEVGKKIDDYVKSKDFEKKVKSIAADVVKNLYKTLWTKHSFWDTDIRQ